MNTAYPPAGTAFLGTFYYVDDFFNYLSYAQQAEDGSFLFTNKAVLADHPPALVNLEWWGVGTLSRLLGGGRLFVSYRVFGVLMGFGFLVIADRWLVRIGLSEGHRLPALLLVSTGGGLGGLLFTFAGRAPGECLDLFTGLFPFIGFLTNPHFTAGTTLLLAGLFLYESSTNWRVTALATSAAMALALVRPYDFVLLVLIRGTAVLLLDPPRRWPRQLAPLLALFPVVAYLYWLFYRNPAFAFYSRTEQGFPSAIHFAWALGPAAALALFGTLGTTVSTESARRARLYLALWCGFALVVIVTNPVAFSLQFLAGIGFPLLALGALGLARYRPSVTLLAAGAMAVTFATALNFVLTPRSFWLTTRETAAVVETLRQTCAKGDIVLSPPEIGLFTYGLTACRSFLSHRISPAHDRNLTEVEGLVAASPARRRAFLDEHRIRHLVLAGDAGTGAEAWLGPGTGWARLATFGTPARLSLYSRSGSAARAP